jgi:hypothetical protein
MSVGRLASPLLLLAASISTGCAARQPPQPLRPRPVAFNEEDFAGYDAVGSTTVSGWAIEAGTPVTLQPAVPYVVEPVLEVLALRGDCEPPDPRYLRYRKITKPIFGASTNLRTYRRATGW